jgi:hypothetical protein
MQEWRNAYTIWVGKPEGKRSLEKSRQKWDYFTKRGLNEIRWQSED